MIDVKLSRKKLDIRICDKWVSTPSVGCVNFFIGKVREKNNDKTVTELFYESYERMALSEMEKISNQAINLFAIENVLIYHRIGRVKTNEIPVIIGVSAKHRRPAIQATQFLIDSLKETVPIWKKEIYKNGESWITNHA